MGSLRGREVSSSTLNRQGSNFKSCIWRAVSSHSSHHPQEVLLAKFSIYVHKGGIQFHSFYLSVLGKMCKRKSEICQAQLYGIIGYQDGVQDGRWAEALE